MLCLRSRSSLRARLQSTATAAAFWERRRAGMPALLGAQFAAARSPGATVETRGRFAALLAKRWQVVQMNAANKEADITPESRNKVGC